MIQRKLIETLEMGGLVVSFALGSAGREWALVRPSDASNIVAARMFKAGATFKVEAFGQTLDSTPCIFEAVATVRSMFRPDIQAALK